MEKNKKNIIILAVLGLIIIIALIIVLTSNSKPKTQTPGTNNNNSVDVSNLSQEEIEALVVSDEASVEYALQTYETLEGATVEIPGISPISKDNQVMTYTGEVADNTVAPGSELAPKSVSLESKAELPSSAVNLDISSAGFSPNTFTVQANSPVTLAITSVDDRAHVIAFDDPSLSAVKFGVLSGATKAMTFAAPSTPGTYSFFCEVPGHKDRGEVGTMVVR